ncbi:MAG: precorrin-6A reductase [Clostridia bacterium]|nr:precorrin-6A reductase [Clostridia bacterium]NCD03482.1 precorrin-6A reductase [Clostridia bacterium]
MNKILIFAGTVEGRRLAEYLVRAGIMVHVCVATDYGEKLLPKGDGITITSKRLTTEEMRTLFVQQDISLIIDATHPYAVLVSQNIKQACMETGKEYMRMLRGSIPEKTEQCTYLDSVEEAVQFLKDTEGNVLLTTGSKELAKFTEIPEYSKRLFARVLSTPTVVNECQKLGFEGRNLICMQGPFSEELNYAMFKQIDAKYMVTKESGNAGGFVEKINAAGRAGVKTIVIGRPCQEEGVTFEECLRILGERFHIKSRKKITLLGIGMGSIDNMTIEGRKACEHADVIIGAKRMLESLTQFHKPVFDSYRPEEINEFIDSHAEYWNIVVALSGDIGFYSGATKLINALETYELEVLPGISSVVYLCSKIKMAWQDVKFISNHGRYENLIGAVKTNQKVFSLLGGQDCVGSLCQKLIYYGLKDVVVYLGEQLSYADEKITKGSPSQLMNLSFTEPCVILIENTEVRNSVISHGISDDSFIRGKVPMTKEEIRSISISKLRLNKDAIIYDIGAGTGSVSVEMALQAIDGTVYAIEKKSEAIALIEENKKKFGADNLLVIEGIAPEAMEQLPEPTHAFIGGSSGNLKDIMMLLLYKNPKVRIVINAITLETISEALHCVKNLEITEVEVVQISISKSQTIGDYHMMMGQNPVYIISCTGK